MLRLTKIYILSISILLLFSYNSTSDLTILSNIQDTRIVILLPVIVILYFLGKHSLVKLDKSFFFAFLMIIYVLVIALITNSYNFFFGLSIFLLFLYWPYIIPKKHFNLVNFYFFLKCYNYTAIIVSVGVFFQFIFYTFFGVEIFHVMFFRERTAFAFIWIDFSYISLYLCNSIPLLFLSFKRRAAFAFSIFFFTASLATSARTGVTSFFFVFLIYIIFFKKNITNYFKLATLSPLILYLIYKVYILMAVRSLENINSDNERFVTYMLGYKFWLNNIMFGNMLVVESYPFMAPHNFLINLLALGGIAFMILYLMWLILIMWLVVKSHEMIILSIAIALFGLNFIPSFFSSYFVAYLLSLALFYNRMREYEK